MSQVKEKNLAIAIGLNVILPGAGYMYMGKYILGVFALLYVVITCIVSSILFAGSTWVGLNIIMAIDMIILNNNNRAKVKMENTKTCPECAELIKKDAKICRYCKTTFESQQV